jgi:predicted RecB family nuclease
MYVDRGTRIVSATDLVAFLGCAHLTHLDLAVADGVLDPPAGDDPAAALLRRRGLAHEQAHLARLQREGRSVVAVPLPGRDRRSLSAAEAHTVAAMAEGVDVVYQASFFDGLFRGHADFLYRVDRPGGRWPWSYEPVDAKLARRPSARALLQLGNYAEHVARVQGSAPAQVHVVDGEGETH